MPDIQLPPNFTVPPNSEVSYPGWKSVQSIINNNIISIVNYIINIINYINNDDKKKNKLRINILGCQRLNLLAIS